VGHPPSSGGAEEDDTANADFCSEGACCEGGTVTRGSVICVGELGKTNTCKREKMSNSGFGAPSESAGEEERTHHPRRGLTRKHTADA